MIWEIFYLDVLATIGIILKSYQLFSRQMKGGKKR